MRPMLLAVLVAVALPAAKCRETASGTPPTKDRVLKEAASTYRYARAFFSRQPDGLSLSRNRCFCDAGLGDACRRRFWRAARGERTLRSPSRRVTVDILSVTVRFRTADGREQTVHMIRNPSMPYS